MKESSGESGSMKEKAIISMEVWRNYRRKSRPMHRIIITDSKKSTLGYVKNPLILSSTL